MRKHILEAQLAEDTGATDDGDNGGGASPFAVTLTLAKVATTCIGSDM